MAVRAASKVLCKGCGDRFVPESDVQYFERMCAHCAANSTAPNPMIDIIERDLQRMQLRQES